MTLDDYQIAAMKTCMHSCENFIYMFIGLIGELGEFAGKIAKGIRKGELVVKDNDLMGFDETDKDLITGLIYELGDCLWMLSGVCTAMGLDFETIAKLNLEKLASRKERGVINGDGDNR